MSRPWAKPSPGRAARGSVDDERIAHALAACFEAWRRPDSSWTTRLCRSQTQFSEANLRSGLTRGLEHWTQRAISDWLRRERSPEGYAPGLTGVIPAGSIPTNSFALVAAPLLAGSAVFAHVPSEDPHSLPLFLESMREVDPGVAEAIELGDARTRLHDFDAVVAEGREETLCEIAASLPAHVPLIRYGHKLSAAALGTDAQIDDAAARLALDLVSFDGRGCLSPGYVWVEDSDGERTNALAAALATELERLRRELPRGSLSDAEHLLLRELRAHWSLCGATRFVCAETGTDWAVAVLPPAGAGGSLPRPGLLRNVPLIPVASEPEWLDSLARLHPWLSALACEGFGGDANVRAAAVAAAGGSRLCGLGMLQRPPIAWRHDGRGAIEVLLRYVDLEGSPQERA